MNRVTLIRRWIYRTLVLVLTVLLAAPAAADGVHNKFAKICQGVSGGAWSVASVGGIATPPTFPGTKFTFDTIAYGSNISLKFCPPVINAPAAVHKDPDTNSSGHECYATFHQPKTADYYDNLYGASLWNRRNLDWGDFGKPYVYDFNTSAYVRMVDPAKRMDVDNVFLTRHLRYIPDSYDPGDIRLPIGYNSVMWRADTTISVADIALPIIFALILPGGNENAEKAVVKSTPKVEEAASDLAEGLVKGSSDQSGTVSKMFPKWLTKQLLEAAVEEVGGQYSNSPTLNWLATQIGQEDIFNGFRTGMFFPRQDLVATGLSVNADIQEVWVYDNDPPTLISNTDPTSFPEALKPLLSYDPNTDTYYVEATGPGITDGSVAAMGRALLVATDACQGARPPLSPYRVVGTGVPVTPQIWHPGDSGSFEWQVADSGPNQSGQPNLSNVVTQQFGVRDTHPPILIAPPSKVVEIDPGTSTDVALGAPRTFDLADYMPTVSNSVGADTINITQPGINTITWTSTDASGNRSTQEQLINVKLTGTNTAPMANDQSVNAVSYEPVDIVLTGYDADVDPNSGRHDPLSFTIKDKPAHGHFIAPLFPYFIDDYRLGKLSQRFASDPWQSDPGGSCSTTFSYGPYNLKYPYNASWITVNDDGSTIVYDQGYILCASYGIDSQNSARLAMFDVDGNLVMSNHQDFGSITVESIYMDWKTKAIYVAYDNSDAGTGSFMYLDKNLNLLNRRDVSSQIDNPVAITADHQGIIYVASQNQIAAYQGPTSAATLSTNTTYKFLGMIENYTDPNPTITGSIKSMATDSYNNLYVSMDNRVLKYAASTITIDPTTQAVSFTKGAFVGWAGKCDSNLDNTVYACDTVNHVSLGFACRDSLCGVNTNSYGDLPGQFFDTRGLAVDPNDILYVSDYNNSRIQRLTSDGVFAGQAKSTGAGYGFILGDFGNPENITVNSDHLYILNKNLLHSLKTTPVTPIDDSSASVTYQSDNNFVGTDNFTFNVTDGLASATGNVAVNVTRNYRPPEVSVPPSYTLDEDGSVSVTLVGSDPDGNLDVLSYTIFSQPKHGTLSGTGANLVYTPDPYYYGTDSFSYTVSDGVYSSAPATVTLTVNPIPHAPQLTVPATQSPGLGFDFDFPVDVFDPDADEALLVTIDWGDGSSDRSGVLVDPNGMAVAANNVILADGSLISDLQSSTGGPVISLGANGKAKPSFHHAYATSGDHIATICVTDQMQINPDGSQQPGAASHPAVCTTTTFTVTLKADLLMSITSAPDHAAAGDSTQFTLTVTNRPFDVNVTEVAQGAAADNVVITGHGSNLLNMIAASGGQGHCRVSNGQFNCALGTLAYNNSTTIDIRSSINALAPGNAQLSLFANRTATAVAALDSEVSGSVSVDPSGYAPHLFRLSSSHGSTEGGDVITITGHHFDALARVDFGTYAATAVSVIDSEHITLSIPAQPVGVVDVTVTNSDGQSSTLSGAFRYLDPQTTGGSGGCSISDNDDGVFDPTFFVMLFVAVACLLRRRREDVA